jgi:selenide,water dikinase
VEYAFDAQTSGGLLIAIAPERAERLVEALRSRNAAAAAIVGEVRERGADPAAIVLR